MQSKISYFNETELEEIDKLIGRRKKVTPIPMASVASIGSVSVAGQVVKFLDIKETP